MECQIEEFRQKSILFQQNLVNTGLLSKLEPDFLSTVFQILGQKLSKRNGASPSPALSVVSLTISQILSETQPKVIDMLLSKQKLCRSHLLVKILFPTFHSRNLIENIRQQVLNDLRVQQLSDQRSYQILSEISWILNYGSSSIPIIHNIEQLSKNSSKLKSQLISLKRMMGNRCEYEEQEKKMKKKAYNQNLQVRQIIRICSNDQFCPELKEKIQVLLRLPKNKTWFGRKLYRLLITQKWTQQEMYLLSQQLKNLSKFKEISGIPLHKVKSTIRIIWIEIDRHLSTKQPDPNLTIIKQTTQQLFSQIPSLNIVQEYPLSEPNLHKIVSLFDTLVGEKASDSEIVLC